MPYEVTNKIAFFSVKRVATENDIQNVLKMRQTILKRNVLDDSTAKSFRQLIKLYPVEIGNVIVKLNNKQIKEVLDFTTELSQWIV